MTEEERFVPIFESWLHDTDLPAPDAGHSVREVTARLPHTRQLGHRRWLPSFQRRVTIPHKTTDTTDLRPSPMPANNGHTPTVIGRTQTMFSPSKALIAGALVVGIGGVLLIAQPFEQQGIVPGAETEPIAPTGVTGDIQLAPSCSEPPPVADGDVLRSRDGECSPQTWTSSDPRLTGEVSWRWNEDTYQTDEGTISVGMDAAYLRNDDGGWACSSGGYVGDGSGMFADALTGTTSTFTCVGAAATQGSRPSSSSGRLGPLPRISSVSSSPAASHRCPNHRLPSRATQHRSSFETSGPSVSG